MIDAYYEDQLYINILYSLTNVLIAEDDQVSTKICNDCNFKLITSYEFKKQVETVQESLETAEYEIQDPDEMEEIECAIEEIGGEVSVQEFDNDSQLFEEEETNVVDETTMEETTMDETTMEEEVIVVPADLICPVCNKQFKTKSSIKKHLRIHLNIKRYKCPECQLSFVHWSSRKDHLMLQHNKEWDLFCPFENCHQQFYRKDKLNNHIRRHHTNEFKFHCTYEDCYAKFVENCQLTKHLQTHVNKKFVCDICSTAFKEKITLTRHMKVHEDVVLKKPPAKTLTIYNLKQEQMMTEDHEMIEYLDENEPSPDARYVCTLCGVACKTNRNLNIHMTRHFEVSFFYYFDWAFKYLTFVNLNFSLN